MGTLTASGIVYIDTMILIYTVERYPAYYPLLEPLWRGDKGVRHCLRWTIAP